MDEQSWFPSQHSLNMTCQTHHHTSHTKYTITHCAAAVGSTGCICNSSPSLPVECRQSPLFHIATSCCISPSCLCAGSLLPSPSSSPQVVTGAASHPCLSASVTFTHLSEFFEQAHHSSFLPLHLPRAVDICIPLFGTFLLLLIRLKIEMCRICIFSLCLTDTAHKAEPL